MDFKESLKLQLKSFEHLLEQSKITPMVNEITELLKEIKGICYFTGVGKNMYVSSRVASTYDSLGIRSIFVDPVHTLHGSMGIFTENDCLFAISKSGNTSELLFFLKALRGLGFDKIIGITSNPSSELYRLSYIALVVDIYHEGDEFNIAPIASNMIFAALLDSIAVEVSSRRGYSKSSFVRNHPGGELGKTKV